MAGICIAMTASLKHLNDKFPLIGAVPQEVNKPNCCLMLKNVTCSKQSLELFFVAAKLERKCFKENKVNF